LTTGICPFATFIPGVTRLAPGYVDRVGFCDHTAAGYMGTMKRPDFWNEAGVSVHFAISKAGEIVQLVNIFDTAFAQGQLGPRVAWPRFDAMGRANPNGYLISIEHEDETELNMQWPAAMYEADLRVKRWCIEECRARGMDVMRFGLDSLTGHYMFDDVDRLHCPGSGWPRERLFADLTRSVAAPVKAPDARFPAVETYHQHDGWGLEDLCISGGERVQLNARKSFSVPELARRISVEWLPKRGYGVVLHGDTGRQAGRFGWSQRREAADGYSHTPAVCLDERGGFEVVAEDPDNPVELFVAHVTAWW
jgi:hypothetical protein